MLRLYFRSYFYTLQWNILRTHRSQLVMSMMVSFVLSFFPRDVLDEILNLTESVSEGFLAYSWYIIRFIKSSCCCWTKAMVSQEIHISWHHLDAVTCTELEVNTCVNIWSSVYLAYISNTLWCNLLMFQVHADFPHFLDAASEECQCHKIKHCFRVLLVGLLFWV